MRQRSSVVFALVLVAGLATLATAATDGHMKLAKGDTVYACDCGASCPCQTLSNNPGKCTCGKEMVKATVESIGEGTVTLKAEGWKEARTFSTNGAYHCNCGPSCTCDTISQKPGTCTCGTELVKTAK